jgi:uncharacterized protein (DUF486 family)
MSRALRDHSLSIFFLAIFLATLVGQAVVGHTDYNHAQIAHNDETLSLGRYVLSSPYWADVMENWQSEYLQFTLYIFATVWLIQRGSTESKQPGEEGTESDEDQQLGRHASGDSPVWARVGGWRTAVFSNSLVIVMGLVWLASWAAQAVTGRVAYNAEQLDHHEAAVSLLQYIGTSDYWDRTLQNWQSEFLAVGSMAALSIYLRQRGSPESKPVGAPHEATGVQG